MLRCAVVGLGWWGRQIVDSVAGSEHLEVVIAVDPAAEPDTASSRGLALVADMNAAVDSVDAVIVATPHTLHPAQVMEAAAAGKHVFCEKPLALNAADARRMVETCREAGVILGVGHERRFEGAMEEVARLAGDGALGELLFLECNWSHDLFARNPASTWRRDPSQAPAGTLTALGVHITDFFQSVAGPVVEVKAISSHRSSTFPGDDVLSVQFRFARGALGVLTNLASTPFYSRLAVFGDAGWAEVKEISNVDIPDPATLTWTGSNGVVHVREFPHTNTVRANLEQWARTIEGSAVYRFSDAELIHNVEILEAIVRSAETGLTQSV
ncbi:MAG: Gfo/Idh/MocA family oxidoreductase [Acidimicrobiia bacterium]|nr:Gfo/Idh/MocA family oxidoreductase [Acidimicrobiia bacterium]MDH4307541.1 Gfo/Idh/MocA family oxidoreductase [Acidimicrobiia bacterium]